ncbi:MAG: sigma-70 family RNA polymerase sigma factor, partial [Thermoanaerobaculum sp.]|nr:sigma-70 family RNA polymerase sigma factor [Thermoanaerobaculum sp.]
DGDMAAFEEIYRRHHRRVYAICLRMLQNTSEAEDLTQEVYLRIWQNLHQYVPGLSFRAWAYRVAHNLFVDHYRRTRKAREATWLEEEFLATLPAADDPFTKAVRKQRLEIAHQALQRLPEELAQLLLLRDFADWSYEELAAHFDLPLGTVKSRLNRARRELAVTIRDLLGLAPGVPA